MRLVFACWWEQSVEDIGNDAQSALVEQNQACNGAASLAAPALTRPRCR